MAKAKSPKLRLAFLNSFQICRPKNPSSMIKSPLPFSPVNSKPFDISFPSFPSPPSSKITPFECVCSSTSCTMQNNEKSTPLSHSKPRNSDDHDTDWPVAPPPSTSARKKDKNKTKKSISWGDSQETESLFSCPPSFNHSLKTIYEEGSKKSVKQRRRFKRYGSKEWKEGVDYCHEKKPNCSGNDESFVVVKRSVDPYEDFKNSMFEMILEKQMFEPKELEQLLMSFLSLNSKLHHKVIIQAFTQILKEVFCG